MVEYTMPCYMYIAINLLLILMDLGVGWWKGNHGSSKRRTRKSEYFGNIFSIKYPGYFSFFEGAGGGGGGGFLQSVSVFNVSLA